MTFRVDAVFFPGDLYRATLATLAADERGEQVLAAIISRQVSLFVGFGPLADVSLQQIVKTQETIVIVFLAARSQCAFYSHCRSAFGGSVGYSKQYGVATLTETNEKNQISRARHFYGLCQHQDRLGHAGNADGGDLIVHYGIGIDTQFLRQRPGGTGLIRWKDEVGYITCVQ